MARYTGVIRSSSVYHETCYGPRDGGCGPRHPYVLPTPANLVFSLDTHNDSLIVEIQRDIAATTPAVTLHLAVSRRELSAHFAKGRTLASHAPGTLK